MERCTMQNFCHKGLVGDYEMVVSAYCYIPETHSSYVWTVLLCSQNELWGTPCVCLSVCPKCLSRTSGQKRQHTQILSSQRIWYAQQVVFSDKHSSHWAHDVVATLNQRRWRWFNVVTTSCGQWDFCICSVITLFLVDFTTSHLFWEDLESADSTC